MASVALPQLHKTAPSVIEDFSRPVLTNGLYNLSREYMLNNGTPHAALLIDALYFLGFEGGEELTEDEIFNLVYKRLGMSRRSVRQGLRTRWFFRRQIIQGRRGRRTYAYRVPHQYSIAVETIINNSKKPISDFQQWNLTDPLVAGDLASLPDYKKALYRQLLIRLYNSTPVAMSREFQSNILNVSARTLRNYDKQLKTKITARYEHHQVSERNLHKIPVVLGATRPEWLEIRKGAEKARKYPLIRFIAWLHLRRGYTVERVRRLTNEYTPGPYNPVRDARRHHDPPAIQF